MENYIDVCSDLKRIDTKDVSEKFLCGVVQKRVWLPTISHQPFQFPVEDCREIGFFFTVLHTVLADQDVFFLGYLNLD